MHHELLLSIECNTIRLSKERIFEFSIIERNVIFCCKLIANCQHIRLIARADGAIVMKLSRLRIYGRSAWDWPNN